jgi:uncharacterized membrane protein
MQKNRLEAFSDGVLAIVITIMVLELKVPHGEHWSDLEPLLPVFVSYVMSFVFIAIYWGNHHHLLHTAQRVNANIILANTHLLFWLSLVPFTTGWMGENHFGPDTVALYAANLFVCGVAYFVLQKTIERSFHAEGKLVDGLQKHSRKGIISQVLYALAIPAAYVHPIISGTVFVITAVMWIIPARELEKALDADRR